MPAHYFPPNIANALQQPGFDAAVGVLAAADAANVKSFTKIRNAGLQKIGPGGVVTPPLPSYGPIVWLGFQVPAGGQDVSFGISENFYAFLPNIVSGYDLLAIMAQGRNQQVFVTVFSTDGTTVLQSLTLPVIAVNTTPAGQILNVKQDCVICCSIMPIPKPPVGQAGGDYCGGQHLTSGSWNGT
jgi:hypothetical protein